MTTKPKLRLGGHLAPGIVAVLLFAVMAFTFVSAPIAGDNAGFGDATVELGSADDIATEQTDSGKFAVVEAQNNQTFAVVKEQTTNADGNKTTKEVKKVKLSDDSPENVNASVFTQNGKVYARATGASGGVTDDIGYHLFGLGSSAEPTVPGESFLVAFEIIDLVLVAALVGAVMLARRDVGGEVVGALGIGGSDDESSSGPAVATDGGSAAAESRRAGSDGGDN
ncbi:hypothetical protein [Haloarchaeobius sp. TZWWS8]|uniref:hypothetical protein n=1 Tax=Haloarchaeobius sp. TZWWS8 TaxID=3446121 RepID=UPI003EB8443E